MLAALYLAFGTSLILATALKLRRRRFEEARSLAVIGFMAGLICAVSFSFIDHKLFALATAILVLLGILGIVANHQVRNPSG